MARIKGPKKTNRYPDEFKIRAIQLAAHQDILAKDVAEDLGIHPILLYRWRKDADEIMGNESHTQNAQGASLLFEK